MFNRNATGKSALIIPEDKIPKSDEEEGKVPVKARKNAGRKSPWSQHQLDDFVDIIVGNEDYKKNSFLETLNSKEMGSYMAKLSWNWSRDVLPGGKVFLFQLINSDQNSKNVLVNANELL